MNNRNLRVMKFVSIFDRGLLALRILRHLEETVGRPIYESFDYICGVSTGAVLALLIGASKKSISEIELMYREISSEVFRRDRSSGLGGLLWNHSYYSTEKWEQILKEKIGNEISKVNLIPFSYLFIMFTVNIISLKNLSEYYKRKKMIA